MTGSTRSSQNLDARRRRLLFRAWHRGSRELDLIMGSFADAHIDGLNDAELSELESLLEAPEPDLYNWLIGTHALPAGHDTALFRRLREFALRKK